MKIEDWQRQLWEQLPPEPTLLAAFADWVEDQGEARADDALMARCLLRFWRWCVLQGLMPRCRPAYDFNIFSVNDVWVWRQGTPTGAAIDSHTLPLSLFSGLPPDGYKAGENDFMPSRIKYSLWFSAADAYRALFIAWLAGQARLTVPLPNEIEPDNPPDNIGG